jgi:DNA polymerase III subunit delta
MIVSISEFIESIGKTSPYGVILFAPGKAPWGKENFEPFLVDQALKKLISTYVDPELRDLAFSVMYAEETNPGAVVEEARTLPFLAERRVILLRNADVFMAMSSDKRSPIQPLLQFIENPVDTALLMLVAPAANKQKQLYKACEKHGVVVESPQLDDKSYATWIRGQVSQNGNKISAEAVALLMDRVGGKMSDMHNAINLVCNFAGADNPVKEEHILAASADVAEATVWALTDAIAASNPESALKALHELLAMNKSPDEILGTFNWLLESAYRAHPDTPLKLGKPFLERKVTPLAKKFTVSRLGAAMGLCTKTHFALRTTGADAHLLLELLTIKLAAARR